MKDTKEKTKVSNAKEDMKDTKEKTKVSNAKEDMKDKECVKHSATGKEDQTQPKKAKNKTTVELHDPPAPPLALDALPVVSPMQQVPVKKGRKKGKSNKPDEDTEDCEDTGGHGGRGRGKARGRGQGRGAKGRGRSATSATTRCPRSNARHDAEIVEIDEGTANNIDKETPSAHAAENRGRGKKRRAPAVDANNAVARGSARGEGRPTESADNKLTQVSQKPKSKNQEKKHANTRTRTRVAKNRDQVLDKDKPLTDKEKKKLATKAKNSRKSSAYHVAFNKAIKDGCDEEEAKVRAKKALCLL